MVIKQISKKNKLIVLISLLVLLVLAYVLVIVLNLPAMQKYDNQVLPNTYLEDLELSGFTYKQAADRLYTITIIL